MFLAVLVFLLSQLAMVTFCRTKGSTLTLLIIAAIAVVAVAFFRRIFP